MKRLYSEWGCENFHLFGTWRSGKSKAITDFLAFTRSAERARNDVCGRGVSGHKTLHPSRVRTGQKW